MYFEIENTPEYIRRARKTEALAVKKSPKEQCPRLELAPFSKAPKVIFENVAIGTTSEKFLEIFNPSKKAQNITLSRDLPPGLEICLPAESLIVEPQTCYTLSILWTPTQPTALRETIRFTDDARGRYDIIVVLKSMVKEKTRKTVKKSPGKIIKRNLQKKSPVLVVKKKEKVVISQRKLNKFDLAQTTELNFKMCGKENSNVYDDCSFGYLPEESLFSTLNNSFKISEVFPNSKNNKKDDCFRLTYNKIESPLLQGNAHRVSKVLKPSNKQNLESTSYDLFDNFDFTPLKSTTVKAEKLEKGPKIILSMDSPDVKENLEVIKINNGTDATHSVICITPFQDSLNNVEDTKENIKYGEGFSALQASKIPNTSSPKELFSPNFTINTDISFIPQRVSTERKVYKISTSTYNEVIEEHGANDKLNSDTYTKSYSPNNPHLLTEQNLQKHTYIGHNMEKDNVKHCRQSLFKESYPGIPNEYQFRNQLSTGNVLNIWSNIRSPPPRSITPPLQSIPEESNYSEVHNQDVTDPKMTTFTINRTFNKTMDKSTTKKQDWSKKAIRCEPELWKVPISCPRKAKKLDEVKNNKEIARDSFKLSDSLRYSGICNSSKMNISTNVYSQSFTIDPFSSSIYFYDEKMVDQFEKEFKKWLNYILTPPSDLDSNVEFKIDIGKAWLENRNKEIPVAPTKEKVCSMYHNSHRLESLRKSARMILQSSEMKQVLQKLYMQIDKKIIAIRNDRNLHLDVGLQKIIMEILLCYNPLWLRIGLEAIYNVIIPLKSNSDIEGLTTFIVQNMFKNPKLRSKQSRSTMPNMLTPHYLEVLKKFTLKKFFTLVLFLDQAKQKKLIPHDPCLFCRNAIWKESKEIIINFTKELIAGIGDITRHLRPLGYVVSHKQSYIDEYKYAVHNIAVDIRDGVRLTKVMEIILLKNNLMCQLRTPPISRLQKIHNVQVALAALSKADFTIVGEITAADIADGHREKTLSLLWQIIHVFRAPLFEKAALIIQTWWKKKYEVIAAERRRQQLIEMERRTAATVIQRRWRQILYVRMLKLKIQKLNQSALVIQKYWRMWAIRKRFLALKWAVFVIEEWYARIKKIKEAKAILKNLWEEKEELRAKSAVKIQSLFRTWLCVKKYKIMKQKIIYVQSCIRRYLHRKKFIRYRNNVLYIQQIYRSKLKMREEMRKLAMMRKSAITIQSYVRMYTLRKKYHKLKKAVCIIKTRYIAKVNMKIERDKYLQIKKSIILLQSYFRGRKVRIVYERQRRSIILLQRKIRATLLMKKDRDEYFKIKRASTVLQKHMKAYLEMKRMRYTYKKIRESVMKIQNYYRLYVIMKTERANYVRLKMATITLQRWFRSLLLMRIQKCNYLKLRTAVSVIQSRYRAKVAMRRKRQEYLNLRKTCFLIQRKYRAKLAMRRDYEKFSCMKIAAVIIQKAVRAHILGKKQRQNFLTQKNAAVTIQKWYRQVRLTREICQHYQQMKQSAVTVQRAYKTYMIRKEYIKIRRAVITIQKYFRSYIEMKITRTMYLQKRNSCIVIQRTYRGYLIKKTVREDYLKKRNAVIVIQKYFRQLKLAKLVRNSYTELKRCTIAMQRRYRSLWMMKKERENYLELKNAVTTLQRHYRALIMMRSQREHFKIMRNAALSIQRRYRAQISMKTERAKYLNLKSTSLVIQRAFRAYLLSKEQRNRYLLQRNCAILIQHWYRRWKETKDLHSYFIKLRASTIVIQKWYRHILQKRANHANRAALTIQKWYKSMILVRECKKSFLKIRRSVIIIQSIYRMHFNRKKFVEMKKAAKLIQNFYWSYRLMKIERQNYLMYRNRIIKLQSYIRCCLQRKHYTKIRTAVKVLQTAYRLMRQRKLLKLQEQQRRVAAVVCIQKYYRRHIALSQYRHVRQKVVYLQKIWRNILIGRLFRCDFLLKRKLMIQLQAHIRGYLVRREMELKREERIKLRLQQKIYRAASKIQAAFRGHLVRVKIAHDKRIVELRQRWRHGALQSNQETLRERNEEALDILKNMYDIEKVIRAFKSLELNTEVYPMTYDHIAYGVVSKIYIYMLATNRSISSVEILVSAALILVNLTRYPKTAPQVYERERISIILKFMLRFSNSETCNLFRILCTLLWLFAKYDGIREDLADYLHTPENKKILSNIKIKIERMTRMTQSAVKNNSIRQSTWLDRNQTLNQSLKVGRLNSSFHLPALNPDYGIQRPNQPRYFEDALQAINCLFSTYKL